MGLQQREGCRKLGPMPLEQGRTPKSWMHCPRDLHVHVKPTANLPAAEDLMPIDFPFPHPTGLAFQQSAIASSLRRLPARTDSATHTSSWTQVAALYTRLLTF